MSLAPRTPRLPTQRPSDSLLDERAGSEYSTHGSFADPRPAPAGCGGTSSGGVAAATDPSASAFCGPDGHVSALALGAAAPAEARATVRRHTAELAWDEWGGRRRLSLRSSARRDAPSRAGCLPPPRQQLGLCASGVDLCGAVDCPWTPDAGSGRAFLLLGLERPPPLPSPCAYSKRTRGPDHTSPRGSESTNDPRALARRLLPRLQQRSVRRSLRRSPRRAAHAAAYEGPYAALPVVMGVPLLLPSCAPSHLPATCAPVAAADVNTATHAGF